MNSSDKSNESEHSEPRDPDHHLIPKHGGYQQLRSFKAALAVYDAAVIFCDRFLDRRSRTHDQMVQAARSGVRNIEEGSMASATSKKTELKLTSVARGSLQELLGDCQDFLRHRKLPIWDKNSPQALAVRNKYRLDQSDPSDSSDPSDPYHIQTTTPEIAANTLLCLIHQATYLLRLQLARLERDFLEHGGFSERLYKVRSQVRNSDQSDRSDQSAPPPACPLCSKPMQLRTARRGAHQGRQFWGCSTYPDCRGTRPADPEPPAPTKTKPPNQGPT